MCRSKVIIYYYICLTEISIDGNRLKLRPKPLTFDSNGDGGTITNSGTFSVTLPVKSITKLKMCLLLGPERDIEDLIKLKLTVCLDFVVHCL